MKRVRVGLRLLLLLVALFAVFFAWIEARRELKRIELREYIRGMEIRVTMPPAGPMIQQTARSRGRA